MGTSDDVLRVFTNGTDHVVALSEADAREVLFEHRGGDREDYDEESMTPVPDDKKILIWVDYDGDISDGSDGPEEPLGLTAATWAAREGRGFLCSTEI